MLNPGSHQADRKFLNKLNRKGMKTKQGFKNLQDFITEMKILMPAYQHVMKKYQLPNSNS